MATKPQQGRVLLGALVATTYLWPSIGRTEIIKFEDMRRGTTATASQCAVHPHAVWVSAYGRGICMRYYYSDAGGSGRQATIFLNGDKPGTMPRQRAKPEEVKDTDTDVMERHAGVISRTMGQPAIYMARMGLDGSSGHHAQRRTKLELHITNAAIDAIKRRHGITDLNMYGQSGGASLVGALLSMRTDINCAVPGSGRLVANPNAIKQNNSISDPALHIMNPYDGIPVIVQRSRAKILVVTDPRDQAVTRDHQDPFVQALLRAGRQAEQFYVTASDPKHHGVARYALAVTGECVRGSTHDQIARVLADVEQKIQTAQPTPNRAPERSRAPAPPIGTPMPTLPAPTPARPEVRYAAPQEPPRPFARQAQPAESAASPRECKAYFPLVGMNVTVPCA
jgi:hypothetical protein